MYGWPMRADIPNADSHLGDGSSTTPRTGICRDWMMVLAIFLLALTARLIFLFNSPDRDWPHSIFYEGDAVMWVDWAAQIDRRLPFQFDLPIHPPAVAYTLAYAYDGLRLSGFLGLKILWCAMSAGACALTFLACAPTLGRRVGAVAALLLCFSFNQYLLATSINSETPYALVLPAIVLLTQRSTTSPHRWPLAPLGSLHGVALLLRPEHPLLMLLFGTWMLFGHRPPITEPMPATRATQRTPPHIRGLAVALMGAVALLACLPWTVHAVMASKRYNALEVKPIDFNAAPIEWTDSAQATLNALPAFARLDNFAAINLLAQTRRGAPAHREPLNGADVIKLLHAEFGWTPRALTPFVLISNQGPFSFALANHPLADGGFSRAALAHPMRGDDPQFACAFPPHNRVFTDGWRVGWDYIRSDPGPWRKNVGRKFQRFTDGVTGGFAAANLPLGREGVRGAVDMFVADTPSARWWRLGMLAVITAGVILAVARRMPVALWLLIILYKLIITLLFYGYARQGASIAPAFYVLMGIAIDSLLLQIDRRWPGWIRGQAMVVGSIVAAMLISDVVMSRRDERITIVGTHVPRPDLGATAFQAFNRIAIRDEFQ